MLSLLPISFHVAGYFRDPVVGVGPLAQAFLKGVPVATVPEVAISKYADAKSGENKVWLAGKTFNVCPVPEPQPPHRAAKQLLGPTALATVRALNPRCDLRSRLKTAVSGDLGSL